MTPTGMASLFAPLKTEKIFAPLPAHKFEMPHGLDQWLRDMLTAHGARLKNLGPNTNSNANTTPSFPTFQMPTTPTAMQGEEYVIHYHLVAFYKFSEV